VRGHGRLRRSQRVDQRSDGKFVMLVEQAQDAEPRGVAEPAKVLGEELDAARRIDHDRHIGI
jgi:hypothetical protein